MRSLLRRIFSLKGQLSVGARPAPKQSLNAEIAPFWGDAPAGVTISADLELEWAFRTTAEPERRQNGARTRQNVGLLIPFCDEARVPITWATVGHLFLDHCERGACGLAHEQMPRPPQLDFWSGDWYRLDPCTDWKRNPGYYAPDLISSIREAKTGHEIGSHSFSHIDFRYHCSTLELIRAEMEECRQLMEQAGLSMRSLIFPRNQMGHHCDSLLSTCGITSVRHRDPRIRLSYPIRSESGVYRMFESMNTRKARWYHYIDKARILLSEAAKRRAAYHIWFHPSDETEILESSLFPIIEHVAALRDCGEVWIATMGELSAYCEAREQVRLGVVRNDSVIRVNLACPYDRYKYGPTELTLKVAVERPPKSVLAEWIGSLEKTELSFELRTSARQLQCLVNVDARDAVVELTF